FDLGLIGFEPDRLQDILKGVGSGGLTDPDSVPEITDQPVSRPGDIWLLGNHRVGCGDSTSAVDVMPVLAGSQPHLMVRLSSCCVAPGACRQRAAHPVY